MHTGFADWYRAVSIEPRADELQKRWQGVEGFVKEATSSDLLLLARLFFGTHPTSEPFIERFRSEFKKLDDAFPMQRNSAELQVLAGAALVALFEYEEQWGLAAALALVSAACGGLRSVPVPAIVEEAHTHLQRSSQSLRTGDGGRPSTPDFGPHLQAVKAACQSNALPSLGAPLASFVESVAKALEETQAWANDVERRQNLFREESDVLWWLFGGHSRDLNIPFSELKEPSACLVAGKELADLLRVPPGPYAADAFLDNVLRQAHPRLLSQVSIAAAVDACPASWRSRLVGDRSPDMDHVSPVHLAVRRSVDAAGKGWQTPFYRASRLKASEKLSPVDLATQTYRERLLYKVMRVLEEQADE